MPRVPCPECAFWIDPPSPADRGACTAELPTLVVLFDDDGKATYHSVWPPTNEEDGCGKGEPIPKSAGDRLPLIAAELRRFGVAKALKAGLGIVSWADLTNRTEAELLECKLIGAKRGLPEILAGLKRRGLELKG